MVSPALLQVPMGSLSPSISRGYLLRKARYSLLVFSSTPKPHPIQDLLYKILMELGNNVQLEVGTGADGSGRNSADSYVYHEQELVGLVKLVSAWHGIGHTVSACQNLPLLTLIDK